jgi:hypothetical protein
MFNKVGSRPVTLFLPGDFLGQLGHVLKQFVFPTDCSHVSEAVLSISNENLTFLIGIS